MKKIFLTILIFLITGCAAQYNLTMNESTIEENVKVAFPKSTVTKQQLQPYLQIDNKVYPAQVESKSYNSDLKEDSDNYYLTYNYSHSYDMFSQSMFVKKCYSEVNLNNTDEKILLSTSNQFNCIHMEDGAFLDNVDINITTKLKVKSHNADKVSGNTYTWNINESNYQNKPINLEINKPINVEKTIKEASNYPLMVIVVAILLFLALVALIIKIKKNKNNKL